MGYEPWGEEGADATAAPFREAPSGLEDPLRPDEHGSTRTTQGGGLRSTTSGVSVPCLPVEAAAESRDAFSEIGTRGVNEGRVRDVAGIELGDLCGMFGIGPGHEQDRHADRPELRCGVEGLHVSG